MMNVVLAVGERFASEGIAWMVEDSFEGLFNELPGATFLERKACEAI